MEKKRALYFLNVIFKIENIKKNNKNYLIVFDDIADSFDYKNKHAIIHYLKDISNDKNLDILILTHNYDFFRQCFSRLGINRKNCFASKIVNGSLVLTGEGRTIKEGVYLKNVFSFWLDNMKRDTNLPVVLCASITFFRNIDELVNNKLYFDTLTSLLHIKETTRSIIWCDIFDIFKSIIPNVKINESLEERLNDKSVLEIIYHCANIISEDINISNTLENKIVLSMAIRLKAEELMQKVLDEDFGSEDSNQTYQLYERILESGLFMSSQLRNLLEAVMVLTPEHIHLNSFMFEPLVDTDGLSLVSLYKQCIELQINSVPVNLA